MKFPIDKFIRDAEAIAGKLSGVLGDDMRRDVVVTNLMGHAVIHHQQGDHDAAAAFARDILRVRPDLYEFWYVYGNALHRAGRSANRDPKPYFAEALAAFATYEAERAKQNPPPRSSVDYLPTIMVTRSEIHYEEGHYLAAVDAANAADTTPDEKIKRDHIAWVRGQAYLELKRPDLAIPDLEKSLAANPDIPEVAAKLGDAHWQSGDIETARRIYREIDDRLANSGRPPFDWGRRDVIIAVLLVERATPPTEAEIYAVLARTFPNHSPARASEPPAPRLFGLMKGKPWQPTQTSLKQLTEEIEGVPVGIKFVGERLFLPRTGDLVKSAYWWADAYERGAKSKAYILISHEPKTATDPRAATRVISMIAAELARHLNPIGIIWNTAKALWPPELFIEQTTKDVSGLPPSYQFTAQYGATAIAIKYGPDFGRPMADGRASIWLRSEGLKIFGLWEVEARGFIGAPADGATMLFGFAQYLLSSSLTVKDGDTYGHDGPGAAKHKVSIAPSSLVGREESYILSLDGTENVLKPIH